MSTIADPAPIDPLAVALGDPAGIGPEIVAKAWEARTSACLPAFFAVGDIRSITAVWQGPVQRIGSPAEANAVFGAALPLIQVEDAGDIIPGEPNMAGARCSLDSLEMAVGLTRAGGAGALVTGPVSKAQLYAIGFSHPGQTEFVAAACRVPAEDAVMLLAGPSLRTVPLTVHCSLASVPGRLSGDLIRNRSRIVHEGMRRDFGIAAPRLAICALNPHAGEEGRFGDEEQRIIAPAIAALRAEGIDASGPHPADSLFAPHARDSFDVALCMYHDQALIPLKALDFDNGVNMTLGLPIVRTSPDHGTAFGIAGRRQAHPGAMIAAIRMAGEAAARRAASTGR